MDLKARKCPKARYASLGVGSTETMGIVVQGAKEWTSKERHLVIASSRQPNSLEEYQLCQEGRRNAGTPVRLDPEDAQACLTSLSQAPAAR
jgi:hypothetical protein